MLITRLTNHVVAWAFTTGTKIKGFTILKTQRVEKPSLKQRIVTCRLDCLCVNKISIIDASLALGALNGRR
jgi:hypothetical protein